MSIIFDCPFCSYSKKVPDNYFGKKIKCPRCLATITLGIPQPTALTALPLPDEDTPLEGTAIELDKSGSMVECPFCYELVSIDEDKCPYCRTPLNIKKKKKTKKFIFGKKEEESIEILFRLGFISLIPVIGLLIGPFVIFKSLFFKRIFSKNNEINIRLKDIVNYSLVMGTCGTFSSLILIAGTLALIKLNLIKNFLKFI